ncbi:hypothetical protein [Bradyrhizobium sp. WD16]|uniref:hypothetical protein n=1 Tax=Bradyrhizobium sp. WD16 TaxID=1521768 RepID=UPI0020A3C241|nr:hypothetical protein [Bradyrhizobium sp. WD16]
MKYPANGRWALIVAAGILAFCASEAQAGLFSFSTDTAQADAAAAPPALAQQAETSKPAKPSRQTKSRRHRTEHSAKAKKTETPPAAETSAADSAAKAGRTGVSENANTEAKPTMPPAIANANAQMLNPAPAQSAAGPAPTPPAAATEATPAEAAPPAEAAAPAADGNIVASDELNDLDKAAVADKPAPRVLRPVSDSVQSASAPGEDVWGHTSLIGKIFIALGSVLTLASAARMFIA